MSVWGLVACRGLAGDGREKYVEAGEAASAFSGGLAWVANRRTSGASTSRRCCATAVGLVDLRSSGRVAVFVDDAPETVDPFDQPNGAGSGQRPGRR